jgi:hypothetical protein
MASMTSAEVDVDGSIVYWITLSLPSTSSQGKYVLIDQATLRKQSGSSVSSRSPEMGSSSNRDSDTTTTLPAYLTEFAAS